MAKATITNTGNTTIEGDIGLNLPGTSITGFTFSTIPGPGVVNGTLHNNDSTSLQAKADLLTAYNFAKAVTPEADKVVGTVDLGGVIISGHAAGHLPPGIYSSGSTMSVATPVVLDAGGNPNAVWIFQIGSSLTTTASVSLANEAQAKNVFWVPTASATIGSGTTFYGTVIAGVSVTVVSGAQVNGRVLGGAIDDTGAVTLDTNYINVPAP
jgi:hypothetical protein